MAGKAGAQRGISAKVLKYALENPGAYMRVEDVAYQFECTEQQVANSFGYLIREGKLPGLKSVQNGHVWLYEPEGNDQTKWELVRKTASDEYGQEAILEDTDGRLWWARPVRAV